MPNSASPTSVRRAPTRPANPSTSPARTSNETSLKAPSRPRSRTSGPPRRDRPASAGTVAERRARPCPGWRSPASASARGRVDIQPAVTQHGHPVGDLEDLFHPVRDEQDGDALSSQGVGRSANSRRTSWAESDAVGSSMIRTRTLSEMALAISTVCCSASVRPRAGASRRVGRRAAEDRLGIAAHPAAVDRRGHDRDGVMKMFSATDRSGKMSAPGRSPRPRVAGRRAGARTTHRLAVDRISPCRVARRRS